MGIPPEDPAQVADRVLPFTRRDLADNVVGVDARRFLANEPLPPVVSQSECRGGFTPPCGEVNSPLRIQTETLPSRMSPLLFDFDITSRGAGARLVPAWRPAAYRSAPQRGGAMTFKDNLRTSHPQTLLAEGRTRRYNRRS